MNFTALITGTLTPRNGLNDAIKISSKIPFKTKLKIHITNKIGRNHGLDGAELEGVRADPDHGDIEGCKDDEAAGNAGFLPPVGNRIKTKKC